jgi:hypothetical protein
VPDTDESIVSLLGSRYPLVRYYARHSLELRFGEQMAIDMSLPGTELERAARAWLEARSPSKTVPTPARSPSQADPTSARAR